MKTAHTTLSVDTRSSLSVRSDRRTDPGASWMRVSRSRCARLTPIVPGATSAKSASTPWARRADARRARGSGVEDAGGGGGGGGGAAMGTGEVVMQRRCSGHGPGAIALSMELPGVGASPICVARYPTRSSRSSRSEVADHGVEHVDDRRRIGGVVVRTVGRLRDLPHGVDIGVLAVRDGEDPHRGSRDRLALALQVVTQIAETPRGALVLAVR